jgi:murein DD-endopeptidase MepM/ murein hydrolase activator NlpD
MFNLKLIILIVAFIWNGTFLLCQNIEESGGGEYIHNPSMKCVSDEDYSRISFMLHDNMNILQNKGILPKSDKNQVVAFAFPLKKAENLTWNNFYGISGFVDQNSDNEVMDYNCGLRTYDGHNGVDYFTWPFQWYLVENDLVHIVAAADGIIIGKEDGNSSYSCDWNGNQNWNAVYLRHNDGSVTWYGHMKKNSLTGKAIGSQVKQGEYLGVVGSSGRSSGPHLHFEVYKSQPFTRFNLIEPHSGSCNTLNNDSWWESQESYQYPVLNTILTHNNVIEFGCPTELEKTYFKNEFKPGEKVYFSRFYKDQKKGSTSFQKVYKPDNTLWRQWQHTFTDDFNASWWFNTQTLPANAEIGEWKYEATYEGSYMQHTFRVTNTSGTADEDTEFNMITFPNPAIDILKLSFPPNDQIQKIAIIIRSVTGKIVLNQTYLGETEGQVDIAHLPNGIYLLECKKEDKTLTKKLIINR